MKSIGKGGQLGSQLMTAMFIFLLVIVTLGIAAGTYIFFGQGYDGRQVEADSLNFKIKECFLNEVIDFAKSEEFYSKCGLNKKVLDESTYMVRIGECRDTGCENLNVLFRLGSNFEACKFTGKNEAYPKCAIERVMKDGKNYEILTGSKQAFRRTA